MDLSDNILQTEVLAATSSQWLRVRSQYSRICANILQLRAVADKELSKERLKRALALSEALEAWHSSAESNQLMLSLDKSDAMRFRLQTSYYYHEALFQLIAMSPPNSESPFWMGCGKCKELLDRSAWEIITSSSTILIEYLLQDQ